MNENRESLETDTEKNTDINVIKPINRDTVHRICSGQVVLSLAIAVKELVENAIDAGSSIIEVKLKEYGSELIEVSDNGSGVASENFEALTLKHYTSKIKQFSDLESIETLGFRGEALSSLCGLSNLTIITKHQRAGLATKLTYDHNGKIVTQIPTAREQGTTTILENLFSTLPVRRKEFLKNTKREFNKMCQLLYAYCLVSKGIKFTCTNLTNKGSKNTVVATEGQNNVRANIINLFGANQISKLIDVDCVSPNDAILTEFNLNSKLETLPFSFEFLISTIEHGNGRSAPDRQFYYINNRPCELSKLIKLVNEIYKQFNCNQYPFVYLNVKTNTSLVDVNVTPDKRQIFIEQEKVLLATVKASLLEIFKTFPSTYKIQNLDISKNLKDRGMKRSLTDSPIRGSIKSGNFLDSFRKRSKTEENVSTSKSYSCDITKFVTKSDSKLDKSDDLIESSLECKYEPKKNLKENVLQKETVLSQMFDESIKEEALVEEVKEKKVKIKTDNPIVKEERGKLSLSVTIKNIRNRLMKKQSNDSKNGIKVRFRSEIDNKNAEAELEKHISKSDFKNMSIIGQFNLGFIITKLNNDLFIIDQHASDEKYNFEQLQATTVLENQKLVNPKMLELTAGHEALLIENEDIFKKNGFSFKIDLNAPSTKKVALTTIPISKNYAFGKDDIDELIFMLQEANNTMCRPSRVRAMFASRACRKSIMIGRALTTPDMKKVIDHMSKIEQPWNCPHGRPTMRHLINLDLISDE